MVPQVIITVTNRDVEGDPTKELFEVRSDVIFGAMRRSEAGGPGNRLLRTRKKSRRRCCACSHA